LIDDRKYTKVILRKENFDKQVFGDTTFINTLRLNYNAFDAFGKYIVVGVQLSARIIRTLRSTIH